MGAFQDEGSITLRQSANAVKPVVSSRQTKALPAKHGAIKNQDNQDIIFQGTEEVLDHWSDQSSPSMSRRQRQKQSSLTPSDNSNNYAIIPYDFWAILSDYIHPENIGAFAGICKDTYDIVNRVHFWKKLYIDFYKPIPGIPERLRPDCMVRSHQLRRNVIRSLFYTYQPFADRLVCPQKLENENPHVLKDHIFVASWQLQIKPGRWVKALKFKKKTRKTLFQHFQMQEDKETKKKVPDCFDEENFEVGLNELDNIHDNPDDGCKLMIVYSQAFAHISPLISGQKVVDVCLTMCGEGFRFHKLLLGFAPSHVYSRNCDSVNFLVLSDINHFKIVDWFHPSFTRYHI